MEEQQLGTNIHLDQQGGDQDPVPLVKDSLGELLYLNTKKMNMKLRTPSHQQFNVWDNMPHSMPVAWEKMLEYQEHLKKQDVKMLYNYQ